MRDSGNIAWRIPKIHVNDLLDLTMSRSLCFEIVGITSAQIYCCGKEKIK